MRARLACVLVFCAGVAWAQDTASDPPSMELLEFLGDFQSAEGEWVDPAQYLDSSDLAQNGKEDSGND